MDIALIGFGNVGQGFAAILQEKAHDLRLEQSFAGRIVAVATATRGTLICPEGLNIMNLLEAARRGSFEHYPDTPGLIRDWDAGRIARESSVDVLIEATPSNLETGQPALDLCHAAFESGKHVILANKGPAVLAFHALKTHAQAVNRLLRLEATVMAGTPTMQLALQALAGCKVSAAQGILNGTTNYILTQMEQGLDYAAALEQAQDMGYAEADPRGDVDGWDAAGKVAILGAALFGLDLQIAEMSVTGITSITAEDVATAREAGERWKLIAKITPKGGSVRPVRLPLSNPLANVGGASNALTLTTDLLGDITLTGPGAGRRETGFALLADLLDIHRLTRA